MNEIDTVRSTLLRERVIALLASPDGRAEAESILLRLVEAAAPGSDDAEFAHRRLAEMLLETHPWRAALHLKALRDIAGEEDDSVHGLLGLCHALLGNFQVALAAYRRALALAPRNPWYHHNLGHLLDAAMKEPAKALGHLRIAHGIEPEELEISASLVHCLGRLGHLDEARALAAEAFGPRPENPDHAALVAWLESGGRGEGVFPASRRAKVRSRTRSVPPATAARADRVPEVLRAKMAEAGYGEPEVALAVELCGAFLTARGPRVIKPEVTAAALEYAFLMVHGGHAATQASVARRYGVSSAALAQRLADVRDALDLVPGDRRYRL